MNVVTDSIRSLQDAPVSKFDSLIADNGQQTFTMEQLIKKKGRQEAIRLLFQLCVVNRNRIKGMLSGDNLRLYNEEYEREEGLFYECAAFIPQLRKGDVPKPKANSRLGQMSTTEGETADIVVRTVKIYLEHYHCMPLARYHDYKLAKVRSKIASPEEIYKMERFFEVLNTRHHFVIAFLLGLFEEVDTNPAVKKRTEWIAYESRWRILWCLPGVTWMQMLEEWWQWLDTKSSLTLPFCLGSLLNPAVPTSKREGTLSFDRTHLRIDSDKTLASYVARRTLQEGLNRLFDFPKTAESLSHPLVLEYAPRCKAIDYQWMIFASFMAIESLYKEIVKKQNMLEELPKALSKTKKRLDAYFKDSLNRPTHILAQAMLLVYHVGQVEELDLETKLKLLKGIVAMTPSMREAFYQECLKKQYSWPHLPSIRVPLETLFDNNPAVTHAEQCFIYLQRGFYQLKWRTLPETTPQETVPVDFGVTFLFIQELGKLCAWPLSPRLIYDLLHGQYLSSKLADSLTSAIKLASELDQQCSKTFVPTAALENFLSAMAQTAPQAETEKQKMLENLVHDVSWSLLSLKGHLLFPLFLDVLQPQGSSLASLSAHFNSHMLLEIVEGQRFAMFSSEVKREGFYFTIHFLDNEWNTQTAHAFLDIAEQRLREDAPLLHLIKNLLRVLCDESHKGDLSEPKDEEDWLTRVLQCHPDVKQLFDSYEGWNPRDKQQIMRSIARFAKEIKVGSRIALRKLRNVSKAVHYAPYNMVAAQGNIWRVHSGFSLLAPNSAKQIENDSYSVCFETVKQMLQQWPRNMPVKMILNLKMAKLEESFDVEVAISESSAVWPSIDLKKMEIDAAAREQKYQEVVCTSIQHPPIQMRMRWLPPLSMEDLTLRLTWLLTGMKSKRYKMAGK